MNGSGLRLAEKSGFRRFALKGWQTKIEGVNWFKSRALM